MAYMDTMGMLMLPVRAVQFLFAIIVLGLTGNIVNVVFEALASISFLLFVSIWTMLALIYLVVSQLKFERFAHKFAILAVEALTCLFWFAGFIAVAADVGTGTCYFSLCKEARAATVFGAFEWLLFTFTTTMATIHVVRTRNSSSTAAAPEMQATAADSTA